MGRSGAWAKGSSTRWRKIRASVLRRNAEENNGQCQLLIDGVCTGKATCVHHVLGRSVTGDDPKYLVASCRECNLYVGQPKLNDPHPKRISRW